MRDQVLKDLVSHLKDVDFILRLMESQRRFLSENV